jgi:hypothetical protein
MARPPQDVEPLDGAIRSGILKGFQSDEELEAWVLLSDGEDKLG